MKKLLISIIIILLLGLCYVVGTKGIKTGALKLESIKDIQTASENLEGKFDESKEISAKTYPTSIDDLDEVVKELKIAKQQYEAKTAGDPNASTSLGVIQVNKYNIEYLWTIIGNYATKNGVKLTLDIKSTNTSDVYDLNFKVQGKYVGITDFIYNLEDDDELKFEISDFKISSQNDETKANTNTIAQNNSAKNNTSNKNNTNSTNKNDGINLYASFTVENIGINLK